MSSVRAGERASDRCVNFEIYLTYGRLRLRYAKRRLLIEAGVNTDSPETHDTSQCGQLDDTGSALALCEDFSGGVLQFDRWVW